MATVVPVRLGRIRADFWHLAQNARVGGVRLLTLKDSRYGFTNPIPCDSHCNANQSRHAHKTRSKGQLLCASRESRRPTPFPENFPLISWRNSAYGLWVFDSHTIREAPSRITQFFPFWWRPQTWNHFCARFVGFFDKLSMMTSFAHRTHLQNAFKSLR